MSDATPQRFSASLAKDAVYKTGLRSFMADDCVFETASGPDACGTRHAGRAHVRAAFAGGFDRFPVVSFEEVRHFVARDRGLSEWVFTATGPDGKRILVQGCDVFTFRDGKIILKSSFLKNRV